MITITEATALRQAKQIFNNDEQQVIDKLKEETAELFVELDKEVFLWENLKLHKKVIDEMTDVAYVFNQLCEIYEVDYMQLLRFGIAKNEKKRKYEHTI